MVTQFLPALDDDARARVCRVRLDIDRSLALMLGSEMVEWVDAGEYPVGDVQVSLPAARAGVSIPPEAHVPAVHSRPERITRVEVANESSLTAARRLNASGLSPLVLNMANGVMPGGGFLHGSIAQEEYLCRSTALYATIRDDPMYGFHAELGHYESSHWAIVSSDVAVIRDDEGAPISEPWMCSFITCAAPVAQRVGRERSAIIMADRIERLLSVAAAHGYQSLVLGAWGCGAFRNDPTLTAEAFRDLLTGTFDGVFSDVVFAISDWSGERRFLRPFAQVLAPAAG